MADERLFQALSFWNLWGEGAFETGIARRTREDLLPWLDRPEVIAICGMRRGGKSTLMRQLVHALVDLGRWRCRRGYSPPSIGTSTPWSRAKSIARL